jgi:hypothetical protein
MYVINSTIDYIKTFYYVTLRNCLEPIEEIGNTFIVNFEVTLNSTITA